MEDLCRYSTYVLTSQFILSLISSDNKILHNINHVMTGKIYQKVYIQMNFNIATVTKALHSAYNDILININFTAFYIAQ